MSRVDGHTLVLPQHARALQSMADTCGLEVPDLLVEVTKLNRQVVGRLTYRRTSDGRVIESASEQDCCASRRCRDG